MPVKVVELEWNSAERLEGLEGYAAADVLLRRGRDPVARLRIPIENGSADLREAVRSVARRLPSCDRPAPGAPLPTVTVAVCTRGARSAGLADALASLAGQELAPIEILVVANGPAELSREEIRRAAPGARLLQEPRPGLDFARNRALREARGEVLAFLDDDARADRWWVRSLAEAFAGEPGAACVSGLILPAEIETPAQELFEANGGFARGLERRVLPRDGARLLGRRVPLASDVLTVGSGCNMAFRVDELRALDGFDGLLDTGAPLPGGGDLDVLYRLLRAGGDVVYEPRALVRHSHRRSLPELREQMTGHARALSAFLVKWLGRERGSARLGVALFLAWRLVKSVLRPLNRLIGRDPLPAPLLGALFVASFAGLGSYAASGLRSARWERRLGGPPPGLGASLADLWRHRELVRELATRDLKVKYQRSWLGFLWTLLNPLVTVAVLVAVFSYVLRIPLDHYWAFLLSGYFAWNLFAQTLNGGLQSAIGNAYLTRSAAFPQEVLVLSASIARLCEFLVELVIVMVVLCVFHHGMLPASFAALFLLVPILFLLVLGVSLPAVALAVRYHDIVQAVPLVTTALFYLTPVFYSLDLVPETFRSLFLLNPLALLLDSFQAALYWGHWPSAAGLLVPGALAGLASVLGYMAFNARKRLFAEVV